MITSQKYVQQARDGNYLGIPYEKLDCQAFVEQVLKDCGEKHNWRGSNHIWRDAVENRTKIENIEEIPAGALVFHVVYDGGERDKGYIDGLGNAKHVGIYLGGGEVEHSTRNSTSNGVQLDSITSSRWTHYALLKCVAYEGQEEQMSIIDCLRLIGKESLFDIYQAAKTLWG